MNSKRIFIFCLFAIYLIFQSCTLTINRSASLEANIKGLGNDSILIECFPLQEKNEEGEFIDPNHSYVVASNDKFTYISPFDKPSFVYISPQKVTIQKSNGRIIAPVYMMALIEPDKKLTIEGALRPYSIEYFVKGTAFNEELSTLKNSYLSSSAEVLKLELQIDSLIQKKDTKLNKKIRNLSKKRYQYIKDISKINRDYIKNNLDNDVAAYLLTEQRLDTLGHYYPKLSEKVRNGLLKNRLDNYYKYYLKEKRRKENAKKVIKGAIAPNFTLKDIDGKERSLTEFSDKIVILDFWGSWCSWCIKGYPKMKSYYKKYKNKLEIIGIACRDHSEDWKKAVKDNQLDWVNLFNPYDSELTIDYGILGYPTKIIIDKNQKIIERYTGETPKFYKKLDELLGK